MRIIMMLLMLIATMSAGAQTKDKEQGKKPELYLYGKVADFLTQNGVDTMSVVLMNVADSMVVDTARIDKWKNENETLIEFILTIKQPGEYLLRIESEGYKTKYVALSLPKLHKREKHRELATTYLQKQRQKLDVELEEVVVQASKVKFFMDGDTLVYNADAFDLPEGSMLDALIKKLPGVELKKGGEIVVNGKKVDELQLNGRELMGSDNQMMLENLPAFMVKNVKVHERAPRDVQGTKHEKSTPKETVMNVKLKREYAKGWIGNVEGGASPVTHGDRRWLGRMFLSRFSDNSRLSIFGNVNNLNDSHTPGEGGDWNAVEQTEGITETYKLGVTGNVSTAEDVTSYRGNAEVTYSEYEGENHINSESFLPDGSTFGRSYNNMKTYSTSIKSDHSFSFWQRTKPTLGILKNVYSRNELTFSHSHSLNRTLSAAATLRDDVAEQWGKEWIDSLLSPQMGDLLQKHAITRTIDRSRQNGRSTDLNINSVITASPLHNDLFRFTIQGNYSFNETNTPSYNHYTLESTAADRQNRYNENFNRNQTGGIYLSGRLGLDAEDHHAISAHFDYKYSTYRTNQSLYLLHKLQGWESDSHPLGDLPSMDEMMSVIDRGNSTVSNMTKNALLPRISYSYQNYNDSTDLMFYCSAGVDFPMISERLAYQRASLDTLMTRNLTLLNPSVSMNIANWKTGFTFYANYSLTVSAPSMTQMIDIVDTSDPLNRVYGNPNLKYQRAHNFNITYRDRLKGDINLNAFAGLNITENAVAMGHVFDRNTGISTMKPENVNGNWNASGQFAVTIPFDKEMKYVLFNNVDYGYTNSVDLSSSVASGTGEWQMIRSVVGTHTLNETMQFDFKPIDKLTLGAKGSFTYRNSSSKRENFSTIRAYDFNYGVTGVYEMPCGFQLSTDLTMYSRRGYSDSSMNNNELVWNARLSKRIKNWSIMLDALDILNNLSNVRYTVNAQGRTETYSNIIPSYALVRVAWHMNRKPKK